MRCGNDSHFSPAISGRRASFPARRAPSEIRMLEKSEFQKELKAEVAGNLLPFWIRHAVDKERGGFYGAVTNNLQVLNDIPRSAILCARILWTFSAAYRLFGAQEYLSMARWAYDYLRRTFWDKEYGGLFFTVDSSGRPVMDRKHYYAQAFGVYGFSEYFRATTESESLTLAQTLFRLMEEHGFDPVHGGYIEGSGRKWDDLVEMRLSPVDLECRKTMNTNLHILEAYTNLLRVWDDPLLKARHKALVETTVAHIIDPATNHFKLFFDDDWTSLSDVRSFGHDIEGSWLLWEAAEVQEDDELRQRIRGPVLAMADAVYREALEEDGSILYEADRRGVVNTGKAWWPQAEAMVGFYNAYQLSGREEFARAAYRLWEYIQTRIVDRVHGEWFKQLDRDGTPDLSHYKIGPWDCPYHASRACYEMLARLEKNQ
jgi:cellobiose epimerase